MSSSLSATQVAEMTKRAEVLALVVQSGDSVSLAGIGRQVGLSRERVRQIARKEGFAARSRGEQRELVCHECGKIFTVRSSRIEQGRRFCSRECAYKVQRPRVERVTFRCEVCGQTYTRKASEVKRGTRFCSRRCQGRWLTTILPRERGHFKQALERLKTRGDGRNESQGAVVLSRRQREMLEYAARGDLNKEIAVVFGISCQTVKNAFSRLLKKMGAKNRPHAVALGLIHGLISGPGDPLGEGAALVAMTQSLSRKDQL